jgi:hypothetical protein
MPTYRTISGIAAALFVAASAGPALAQDQYAGQSGAERCGELYSCIDLKPLSAEQARRSIGYPQTQPRPQTGQVGTRKAGKG